MDDCILMFAAIAVDQCKWIAPIISVCVCLSGEFSEEASGLGNGYS